MFSWVSNFIPGEKQHSISSDGTNRQCLKPVALVNLWKSSILWYLITGTRSLCSSGYYSIIIRGKCESDKFKLSSLKNRI